MAFVKVHNYAPSPKHVKGMATGTKTGSNRNPGPVTMRGMKAIGAVPHAAEPARRGAVAKGVPEANRAFKPMGGFKRNMGASSPQGKQGPKGGIGTQREPMKQRAKGASKAIKRPMLSTKVASNYYESPAHVLPPTRPL
jgi:hypothetical protein